MLEVLENRFRYKQEIDNLNNSNCGQQIAKDFNLREQINIAEAAMKQMPQVTLKTEHLFSFGVYARTIYIPKGVILTGHIHKFENLNILLKGKIQVSIGDKVETIEAPFVVVSPANTKRIAQALEDCIWMTILGSHEKNLDCIEDHFIAKSEEEYLEYCNNQLKLPGF